MKIIIIAACLLFSFSLAVGQLMFKLAADHMQSKGGFSLIGLVSPMMLGAVALYAFSTLLWVWILSSTALSKAYPFALLGAALVPLMAVFLLKESISASYPLGMAMVIIGVLIINLGP